MIFAVGMLVLATAALLAPYLQVLAGRSVVETGLLLAPRGAGNFVSVIIAGRLSNRVDPRLTMFFGILLIAESLWEMMGWTPDIDAWSLTRKRHHSRFRPWLRVHAVASSCVFDPAG
jgi:DHA2 family multidrug resistance protein